MTSHYFDIKINNNTFYIVEDPSKPKPTSHGLALATLEKIEVILRKGLTYHNPQNAHDDYSKKTTSDLFEILKTKSLDIFDKYKDKQSKSTSTLDWIAQKTFGTEKKIDAIHTRIENHSALVDKAQKFGYFGNNAEQASKYLKDLFEEVGAAANQGIIPEEHVVYKPNLELDSEKILGNLQGLSIEEVFSIFSHKQLYSPSLQTFRNILNLEKFSKISNPEKISEAAKQNGAQALNLAAACDQADILNILLMHGANPNVGKRLENPSSQIVADIFEAA